VIGEGPDAASGLVGRRVNDVGGGKEPLSSSPECGERLAVGVEVVPGRGLLSAVPAAAWDLMSWSFFLMRCDVVARGPFGPGFNGVFAKEQSNWALTHGRHGHSPEHLILRNEHTSLPFG
jgi:hypothetical protein